VFATDGVRLPSGSHRSALNEGVVELSNLRVNEDVFTSGSEHEIRAALKDFQHGGFQFSELWGVD